MNKSLQIALITLKNKRGLIITLITINILMLVMYGAMWPSLQAQTESLNTLLASMPQGLLKAFNLSSNYNNGLEALLITKQLSLVLPVLMLILVNGLASTAIAGEIDKDTILLYLTQPITRLNYFLSKYVTGLVAIFVFAFLSIMPAIPIARIFNAEVQPEHFIVFTTSVFLFGWALYAIAYVVSAFSSEASKVTAISTGVFLFAYITNVVYQLVDQLVNLKYISLMYYMGPADQLIPYSVPVFLAVIVLGTVSAAYVFVNRDISIR